MRFLAKRLGAKPLAKFLPLAALGVALLGASAAEARPQEDAAGVVLAGGYWYDPPPRWVPGPPRRHWGPPPGHWHRPRVYHPPPVYYHPPPPRVWYPPPRPYYPPPRPYYRY